jgi:glycosyltransferase involved in cell wall biosynthesis
MTAAPPIASIVIPHLNQPDALIHCLTSLEAQTFGGGAIEIIVVDNGSRQRLDQMMRKFPTVRLLEQSQPGPGLARNVGVAAARADTLLFIDADCRAHPEWVARAITALTVPNPPDVIGGDVQIDVVDPARLTPLEAYESVFAYRQSLYITREGFSGTGNLAMRRRIFDAVGPFGGIGIAEDRDWGQRARSLGHITRYVPGMIVYHPARKSFEELTEKWRRHIAHDLAKYRGEGGTAFGWMLRAIAMIASIVPHSLSVLHSPRLTGFGNRMRAICVLSQIRWFRCAEMLRQSRAKGEGAANSWNR